MVPYTNESSHFWLTAGTTTAVATATATAGGGGGDDDVDHDHDHDDSIIPSRNSSSSSSSSTSRNEKQQKKEYYHSHRRKQQQQENHHPREGTARATTSDTTASLVVEEGTAARGRVRREDKIWSLALPWIAIVMVAIISALLQLALRTKQQDEEEVQMTTTTTTFMMMGEDFQKEDEEDDDEEEKDYSSFFSSIDNNNHSNRDLQQQEEQLDEGVVDEDYTTHTSHHQVYNEDHDPLYPLSSDDKIGFFLATIGLMVAAGGGIGGGGILVPIYILVMGFSPKHAIPLSNITVFGGSIANTILNTRKRHPFADRPLVDWDLILVMEPLTIAGALIGAFLNKVLPEMLLTIMLVVLLSFTAYNSLKKAMKMYKKETAAMKAISGINPIDGNKESELTRAIDEQNNEQQIEAAEKLLQQEGNGNNENENNENDGGVFIKKEEYMTDEEKDLIALLEEEKVTPTTNLTILIVMFIVIIAINLLKGGGAFPSPIGITCGSFSFWIANLIMLLWILIISIYVRILLIRKYHRKEQCLFPYVEGDIKWDSRATIIYPVICCLAGFFAGMFGVGGGIVKGPLMLAMGVHPAVSSASSACMILFTSFTATTSFLVFGLLVPDYGVVCLCIGFVATLFGQIGLGYLMKRAQRNSYIAFSIGIVVLLSAFLMTIQSLLSMAEGEHHHAGGICGKGD